MGLALIPVHTLEFKGLKALQQQLIKRGQGYGGKIRVDHHVKTSQIFAPKH